MRKYENLYAGLIKKKLIGGVDLDLLDKSRYRNPRKTGQVATQLDIYAANGEMVGFISIDALKLSFEGRDKNERKETKESDSITGKGGTTESCLHGV